MAQDREAKGQSFRAVRREKRESSSLSVCVCVCVCMRASLRDVEKHSLSPFKSFSKRKDNKGFSDIKYETVALIPNSRHSRRWNVSLWLAKTIKKAECIMEISERLGRVGLEFWARFPSKV